MLTFPLYLTYIGPNDITGHYKHAYMPDPNRVAFINNIPVSPVPTYRLSTSHTVTAWGMSIAVSDLPYYRGVLCFTLESHPELFI